jgi:hypothetical protein
MAEQKTAVLQFQTSVRPFITIDGKKFELHTADEFSFAAVQRYGKSVVKFRQLFAKKRPSPREQQERDRILQELAEMILIAPPAIHTKLSNTQRTMLVAAFAQRLTAPATKK